MDEIDKLIDMHASDQKSQSSSISYTSKSPSRDRDRKGSSRASPDFMRNTNKNKTSQRLIKPIPM